MQQFKATRHATAQSFTCGRCGKHKVSKNTYAWTSDAHEAKTICNGCHGELMANAVPKDSDELGRKLAADLEDAGFEVVDGDVALSWSDAEKKRMFERRADSKGKGPR